jgi:hypothetical protein
MSEDITQDPEYISGYERGRRDYNSRFTPGKRGYSDGWDAAESAFKAQKTVESRPVPVQTEQGETLEEQLDDHEKRLKKLEEYYARYTQE